MQANVNQKLTNLSLHQPGFAPNSNHNDIIYEDIESYLETTEVVEVYDNAQQQQSNAPAEDGEVYVDMIPPASTAQNEDVYEHYVDVQPPTLVHSKPEEDYELYVDVEPPKSHSGQPQGFYMDVLPQSNECYEDGEPFYDAINYEAITSLRNPTTPAGKKINVTQSLPGRPLPRTPDEKPKRRAPPPPQAKLKTQSSVTVDNRPPSLKPQFRQSSLPAEPPTVHMRSTNRQTQAVQNEHPSQTDNTVEEPPPLFPKHTPPSLPPNPAAPARPPKPTPQNAADKRLAHKTPVSPIAPPSQQNVIQSAPIIANCKPPPSPQVVRATVERTTSKPPQAGSPGIGPKPASIERAVSPNPKHQKAISSSTGTKPAILAEAPSSVASPTAESNTKPQVQEHVHNLANEPVHSSADSVPNVSGHSIKAPNDRQNSELRKSQSAVSITYHAEGPVQPDQKVGHSPSPVAQRLPHQHSEPILPFEAPPSYHQIYPQQPQPLHPQQPYPQQAYPQQQPRPQQPYPQQPYPRPQLPPQQPYPQQQPRPQHPPHPQPPYPYPQQSYPPQPYPQQPYPQQQRYPYPQTVNKQPFPPQPHVASPYRPPYPQQPPQPAYRPPYPPQQYHQQYMYRAPMVQQQAGFVQIQMGGGGVMTFGGGGMMPQTSNVVSVPMQAANAKKGKGKKKK